MGAGTAGRPKPGRRPSAQEVRISSLTGEMSSSFLPNGVQVLTEKIPGVRSAAVGVWVRQGSAHESAELMGASHLLEHLVFKGTHRRTAKEIALALESLGGSLDAYTSREHTSFQARVLDEDLPLAIEVLADLVLDPLLREEDLSLEREVVLEEIATVEDTPDDLVFDLHGARLWAGHPYGQHDPGNEGDCGGHVGGCPPGPPHVPLHGPTASSWPRRVGWITGRSSLRLEPSSGGWRRGRDRLPCRIRRRRRRGRTG